MKAETLCLISIVIPCRNSEKTLALTLTSLAHQNFNGRYEVIVVDNGSTDRTVTVAKSFDVKVLTCNKIGAASARNFGASSVSSPYLAFVDSDVCLDSNWLQMNYDCLHSSPFSVSVGAIRPTSNLSECRSILNRFRKKLARIKSAGTYVSVNYYGQILPLINTAACFMKTSAYRRTTGFDERLLRLEDSDFFVRAFHLSGLHFVVAEGARAAVYFDGCLQSYLRREYRCGVSIVHLARLRQSMYPKAYRQFIFQTIFSRPSRNLWWVCRFDEKLLMGALWLARAAGVTTAALIYRERKPVPQNETYSLDLRNAHLVLKKQDSSFVRIAPDQRLIAHCGRIDVFDRLKKVAAFVETELQFSKALYSDDL